jgi:glucose/arabinose dehydrogenase
LLIAAAVVTGACSGASSDPSASPTALAPASRPPASPTPSGAPSTPRTAAAGATPGPEARPVVTGAVAQGLEAPWGLAFLPDGSALVSERDRGRIVRVGSGGQVTPVGEVPGVDPGGEGGLLGLAISPTFAQDRLVYAYFTASEDNRVVRMRYDESGRLGAPSIVLAGLRKARLHNGGRIAFGPDGFLYVATGDATERGLAQDRDALNGKILRMTAEGQPAPGNPFAGSLVYSLGHRNVQGLAWDSRGRLWASEFGQHAFDELNLIEPGRNYGWPEVEGTGGGDGFTDPQATWATDDASPSGIAIAGDAVYLAGLRGSRLWQVPITGGRAGEPRAFLTGEYGRLRTVAVAANGALWVTTSNTDGRGSPRAGDDRILRLTLR